MINTVRGRLTLWYVSALALILVVFGVALYVMLSRALHRRVDEALRSTLEISITSLTHDTQEGQHTTGGHPLHHPRQPAARSGRGRVGVAPRDSLPRDARGAARGRARGLVPRPRGSRAGGRDGEEGAPARGRQPRPAVARRQPARRAGTTRHQLQRAARAPRRGLRRAAAVHGRRLARAAHAALGDEHGGGCDAEEGAPGGGGVPRGASDDGRADPAALPHRAGHVHPRARRRRPLPLPVLREVGTYDRRLKPEGVTRVSSAGRDFTFIVFDTSGYAATE